MTKCLFLCSQAAKAAAEDSAKTAARVMEAETETAVKKGWVTAEEGSAAVERAKVAWSVATVAATEAVKAAAEGVAKAADEADAATHEVKQEKVRKQHNITKTAHSFQSCCSQRAALLACVQDESVEGTGTMVDESASQDTKICVDYEPCKKTVGCSKMCPAGKKHRGMCVVNGKALKPDKMQTDEPKAGADDVLGALGADRVLRERKHPMQKFLEDAESSLLNTPQPETPQPKKKRKAADTETSAKKKLALLEKEMAAKEKEMAALKKQLAKQ